VTIPIWQVVEVITLFLTIPVLALEYYWLVLLGTSTRYPRNLATQEVKLTNHPTVSVLIASFNERYVIDRTLDAIKRIDYPKDKLQVVVADDSTDQTVEIVDQKARELNSYGISTIVSRRPNREHFKCGALNKAMESVLGEFVLLLDADSIVPPDILTKGIDAVESHPRASFAAFRYGHYNRNDNMITRLFALSQDIGDTLSKMGAYFIDAPFSFQGGFALVRTKDLKDVGQWSNERIADDGDVSIKLYLAGKRGIYLSNVRVMSEDPSTLEAWKKQVARTAQGWWRCVAKYFRTIVVAPDVSIRKKAGLLLMLLGPLSGFSWILVTFLSAIAIVTGAVQPVNSIFNNPLYIGVVAVPIALSMASGVWALWIQRQLTARNLLLIPMLGYVTGAMLSLGSIAFFYGVFDRTGFFLYRTPKSGSGETTRMTYFRHLTNDRNAIVEGVLAVAAMAIAVPVYVHGVWFLSLSLVGFGLFTLKSMSLSRHIPSRQPAVASKQGVVESSATKPDEIGVAPQAQA
jgi:cellulose synthase/poly-beta-1,6-N-acetylglucosamine synthase-like glycosyltransferase